jgi:hypothetical protein
MVALLLCACGQGVPIAADCARLRGAAGLCCGDSQAAADFGTVSEFASGIARHCRGRLCRCCGCVGEAGLVKLGHVALDGAKIKANTSKHKAAMSYGPMVEPEPKLAAEMAGSLKAAGHLDRAGGTAGMVSRGVVTRRQAG